MLNEDTYPVAILLFGGSSRTEKEFLDEYMFSAAYLEYGHEYV
jgi:hypothetical protein